MKINHKILSNLWNIILLAILIYFFSTRIPLIVAQFKTEGKTASAFQLNLTNGHSFSTAHLSKPLVLVFWATWCGPCGVELSRLQKLIEKGSIRPEDVLAISSFEDERLVKDVVSQRGYSFLVGTDPNGEIATQFNVTGTPTIVFLNKDRTILWITTGLSPLLELRVKNFIVDQ